MACKRIKAYQLDGVMTNGLAMPSVLTQRRGCDNVHINKGNKLVFHSLWQNVNI